MSVNVKQIRAVSEALHAAWSAGALRERKTLTDFTDEAAALLLHAETLACRCGPNEGCSECPR